MGNADLVMKKYMANNKVFADAFNYFFRKTGIVINPEELQELDPTLIVKLPGNNRSKFWQRVRDLLKRAVIMRDGQRIFLLLGIENQSDIHYAMPVRAALYDAMQYAIQVDGIGKAHRENDKGKNVSSADFLSGFTKEDRLLPVITLVIYFGPEKWTAPRRLHEMLALKNKELLKFIPDYKINLIEPDAMSDEELELFSTGLKSAFRFIKNSKNKELLEKMFQIYKEFESLDFETAQLIKELTKSDESEALNKEKIELDIKQDKEGRVNMCKALVDIKLEGKAELILNAMENHYLTLQGAMDWFKIPASDRPMYAKAIADLKAKREKDLVH